MKRYKRLFSVLLSLCLICLTVAPVRAAQLPEGGDTTTGDNTGAGGDTTTGDNTGTDGGGSSSFGSGRSYTIRLFAGKQGEFKEGDKELLTLERTYGQQVTFQMNSVRLINGEKYYIKGFRESGKDNSEAETYPAFNVTGDQDYVVAYGVLSDATTYTINYVDTAGRALAPSETYYGNVGDRPVIAYLYIDGYQPQAYNLTKRLVDDPMENVFTFTYTRIATGGGGGTTEEDEGTTTTPAPPAPGASGTPAAPAAGGAAAAGAGAGGAGGGGAAAGVPGADEGAGPGGVEVPDEETPLAEPEELQDLDEIPDEEVPLVNMFGGDARLLGIPVPVLIAASLALMGGITYFVILKKRKKKEVEEEEES